MTRVLVDTSVLIKWFHSDGEGELTQSRALRAAHLVGDIDVHTLDLAIYEVGDVLTRALKWSAGDVADQLDDLRAILGPPLTLAPEWSRSAAFLAHAHAVSFYDACWAAAAAELRIPLVTADVRLLDARLAESPTEITSRLSIA